jgi:hypothetical protein
MRRAIEDLNKKNIYGCWTSYILIDYLFSSLPLPPAVIFLNLMNRINKFTAAGVYSSEGRHCVTSWL